MRRLIGVSDPSTAPDKAGVMSDTTSVTLEPSARVLGRLCSPIAERLFVTLVPDDLGYVGCSGVLGAIPGFNHGAAIEGEQWGCKSFALCWPRWDRFLYTATKYRA